MTDRHYIGCNLNIYDKTFIPLFFYLTWQGEGDNMIFINDDDLEKTIGRQLRIGIKKNFTNNRFFKNYWIKEEENL